MHSSISEPPASWVSATSTCRSCRRAGSSNWRAPPASPEPRPSSACRLNVAWPHWWRSPALLQASTQDDVLDVLDRLLTDLLARVDRQEQRSRLRTIGDLDIAALLLRDISLRVLDQSRSDRTMRQEIFARWPRERIEHAVAT